jgi:hypothetical protein
MVLHVVDGFTGALYRDYAAWRSEVSDALVEDGFPLPLAARRLLSQKDSSMSIEPRRASNAETFGTGAGRQCG